MISFELGILMLDLNSFLEASSCSFFGSVIGSIVWQEIRRRRDLVSSPTLKMIKARSKQSP